MLPMLSWIRNYGMSAGHLINKLPTLVNEGKTPLEAWAGHSDTIYGC